MRTFLRLPSNLKSALGKQFANTINPRRVCIHAGDFFVYRERSYIVFATLCCGSAGRLSFPAFLLNVHFCDNAGMGFYICVKVIYCVDPFCAGIYTAALLNLCIGINKAP